MALFNNGNKSTTVTVAAGVGSATFQNLDTARLVHLYIIPATSTTTYTWKITDKNGIELTEETNITGQRSILNSRDLPEYIYGNFTISLSSVSVDEDFVILPIINEVT